LGKEPSKKGLEGKENKEERKMKNKKGNGRVLDASAFSVDLVVGRTKMELSAAGDNTASERVLRPSAEI